MNPYRDLTYDQRSGLPLALPALDDLLERFASWDHIERRWHRVTVLEVTHPQVAPGELPLGVGSFLQDSRERFIDRSLTNENVL